MARKQVGQIDAELLARVDAARGDVPRTRWVERALEAALEEPPYGYPFEAERQAVKAAVEGGATGVRVEAGSVRPAKSSVSSRPAVSSHVRPAIPKKEK